ncbi:MAG: CrcB family protein [Bacteroidetes bacterium]|nr:CrcB family protein [Bacteroidota bacterium]MCH8524570.1 CrcB family protein [Balneolales bacterium]
MSRIKQHLSALGWVAAGGMIGALLRHGTNQLVITAFGMQWIYLSTSFENIFGSFLMGFLFTRLTGSGHKRDWLGHFLLVGMIGSYTTYSGFGVQSITLIQESAPLFLLYFFGQVFGGLIAVLGGIRLAEQLKSAD